MSRPVTWWRLYRGKVWHLGWAGDAAACGTEPEGKPEYVGERAPVNARVCGDCVATALHLYAMAQAGQMGDPRSKTVDRWAAGEAILDAERPRVGDDEWPCGNCGHANFDHDCDDGTCVVTKADTGDQCPCRGLKRAG